MGWRNSCHEREQRKRKNIYIYELEVGIKGIVLAVIRQPMRVLQLLGRQFGSQQTRATSSRHDGYKLCRWPIYMAAILANSTRSLFVAEIPTYVRTWKRSSKKRSIVVERFDRFVWPDEKHSADSRFTSDKNSEDAWGRDGETSRSIRFQEREKDATVWMKIEKLVFWHSIEGIQAIQVKRRKIFGEI